MQTSILIEFLTLAEMNSFSKAARHLSISQATLSRHIQQLEAESGVELFNRTTQKMSLSPYGEALIPYAKNIVSQENEYRRAIEHLKFKTASHLTVGSVTFPHFYGITSLFGSFKQKHPDATIEVHVGSTDEIIRMLDAGMIDIAFVHRYADFPEHYISRLYCPDHISVIVSANHPLAGQKSATIDDFREDTFYFRYQKDALADGFYAEIFKKAGFFPKQSANHGTLEDSVINGGNDVSLALQGLADVLAGNLHVRVLELVPEIRCDIYAVRDRNVCPSDIAEDFFQALGNPCA